jgi:GntR family transcriptional regulator
MATRNGNRAFAFRLDERSGVPVYRQLIDQVLAARAAGALTGGDQLPTVRQVAVDLAINPNTVARAWREMEIRGIIETQQGTGTFISQQKVEGREVERRRQLDRLIDDFIARAGAAGFRLDDLIDQLQERQKDACPGKKRK